MADIRMSNNHREALGAISSVSGNFEYLNSTNGALNTTGGGGGGGGTQYTEGVSTSPGIGTLAIGRYNSSAPTLTSGELFGLQLDSSGNLNVNIKAGSSSGTQYAEGTTTSPGTGTAILGRYLTSPSGGLTNGQMSMPLMDNFGQLKVVPVGTAAINVTQINGSSISLGQTTMANSLPVAIASNQGALSVTQSGTWTVGLSTGSNTIGAVTQASGPWTENLTQIAGNAISSAASGTQKVGISDSLGNSVSAFPATYLRTTDEAHQLFYDAFDTALDTTNRWTSTSGNSGVAASTSGGVMSMGTGTVANGYAKLTSQPSFTLPIPAWLGASDAIALPDGVSPTANSYRYWGTGTTPGTPSVSTPVTDGYGFELNTDGKMRAVVYNAGTRTVIQDLSGTGNATQPVDASYHRYIIYIRTDKAYWYIDGITSTNLVATSNFQSSSVQGLPRLFLTIGNSTPPASNTQIQCTGATAWDTGKNSVQLSDGTFPWRKAAIDSTGSQQVVQKAATGTLSNVASSASNVVILAANTARKAATVYNDSTQILYLKFGTTASTTSFTVPLAATTYYEVPGGYTGELDGIWASANGNARVTELT